MRIAIILLATAFVLVGAPVAAAADTEPDCEADQPWIGYRSTSAIRDGYYEIVGGNAALSSVNTCEGEHWDGQDSVSAQDGSCSGSLNTDPNALHVGVCGEQDVNTNPGDDPLTPLGVRVSASDESVYTGVNIVAVGRAATYVDEGTVAIYLRDNTPGNLLATVVSTPRITQGHVAETDCDQPTYQAGALAGDARCGRDNTAITVEHGLLA